MEAPPPNAVKPGSLAELQALIKQYPHLRAFAALHSGKPWSSPEYLDTKGFDQILEITPDTVTTQSGVYFGTLLQALALRGRTIANVPSIAGATIGGLVSTGAHGSGTASISAEVLELTLVKADGTVVTIQKGDSAFPYAIVSSGLMGIIYSLKLRTVPDRTLYQVRTYQNLPKDWLSWLRTGLYRQLFVNPYRNKALLYDQSFDRPFGKDSTSFFGHLLNNNTGEWVAEEVYQEAPNLLPDFINLTYQTLAGRSSGPARNVLTIQEYSNIKFIDYEVAVPVEKAQETYTKVVDFILQWRKTKKYFLWFGFFLRRVTKEAGPLALGGAGEVIAFEFPLYASPESYQFIAALHPLLGNRFHTGKYSPVPITHHAGWREFDVVRKQFDPTGKFLPTM